jgi:hypothetical protein
MRGQAAKLQEALGKHIAKADELRTALEEHEQASYLPDLRPRGDRGINAAGGEVPLGPQQPPRWPKSMRLAEEIRLMLSRAAALDSRPVNAGGSISGSDLDELLASIPADSIAPTEAAIRAWFASATARAEAEWERYCCEDFARGEAPAAHTIAYQLVWGPGGVIDERRSRAVPDQVRELAPAQRKPKVA